MRAAAVAAAWLAGLGLGWATSGDVFVIACTAVLLAALSGYSKAYSP